MKILLLTQWFDPEPTFKGLAFAKALRDRGHEVQVLTGFPNYPGGRIYPGFKIRPFQIESVDGIRIVRVPLYPEHSTSAVGRVLNYVSFAMSSAILGPLLVRKIDVVYCYHPPATAAAAALVFSLLGKPFVLDIQDLWPDTLAATGMVNSRLALRLAGKVCGKIYARASRIVVLSPGFRKTLIARGVPPTKVSVIYNWADDAHLNADPQPTAPDPRFEGKFNVVFAGTMGKAQALDAVLDAAKQISSAGQDRIQLILVGGGIERARLAERARAEKIGNVLFLERLPISEVGRVIRAADVALVHLKNDPLFAITIPSKIQAYLAVGKPILVAVPGDAADLVARARAGISARSEDAGDLSQKIVELSQMPPEKLAALGKNGLDFYRRELATPVGTEQFAALFERLRPRSVITDVGQRFFDVILSALGILASLPVMVGVALAIRISLGRPVFFRQQRAGLYGKPFAIFKFRTMSDKTDARGELLSDAERITPLGKFIRKYSLDELPQLFNVFIGNLSLVGPRPLLLRYLERYSSEQARRLDVKPGITGWAQVNGRNAISWEARFTRDLEYVAHRSLALYFKILALTVVKAVRHEGISQNDHATMPEFMGTTHASSVEG